MSNTTTIKTEWIDSILDVIRFVFHHTSLEYDGANRVTRVQYRGPKGWSISTSVQHHDNVHVLSDAESGTGDGPRCMFDNEEEIK